MMHDEVGMLKDDRLDRFWPMIERELDTVPHTWAPWWTKDALYSFSQMGRIQCWASGVDGEIRVIAFSQVAQFPANTILQIFLCFGNGIDDAIPALVAAFRRFAEMMNCTMVEVTGRPGWEPKLRPIGFRRVSSTLAMRLEHNNVTVN